MKRPPEIDEHLLSLMLIPQKKSRINKKEKSNPIILKVFNAITAKKLVE